MTENPKTKLGRLPQRGVDDREVINAILDEGFVCHVGYVVDRRPVVLPTLYVRDGDRVLLHGSNSMGLAKAVRRGSPLSVAVTHIDGVVVARTGFHSSANYRSVVIHGEGTILDGEEHAHALDLVVEGLIPGRPSDVREATPSEIKQTTVVALGLSEVSAKVRTGDPIDDPEDLGTGVWAGVLPMEVVFGTPYPAADLEPDVPIPDYLIDFER